MLRLGAHLNPIRAGIADGMGELGRYPYSGHSVLMGKVKKDWQDTEGVLGMFGVFFVTGQ